MSLMIGVPTYNGQLHHATVGGMLQTAHFCAKAGIGFTVEIVPHDAFIGKARATICERFLKSEFNDLLFVDADIGFTVKDVIQICRADVDVAMGLYRLKIEGADEGKQMKFPALMHDPIKRHEKDPFLIGLQYGPAGFLKIRRPVLEKMIEKYPEEYWNGDDGKTHDFFPCGRHEHYFFGEDIGFCTRLGQMGIDLWGVQNLSLDHYGEKKWPSKWRIDIPPEEANGTHVPV